jgi:ABC-type nickel/cobalt efflux system permease component RcnA
MNAEFHAHALSAPEMSVLMAGVAGVAVLHTLAGPDHYLPFIAMGRARRWSIARTTFWIVLCGLGHVGASVLLALAGVFFGYGLERVQFLEEIRGNAAAWGMIAFGVVYLAWGLKKAVRRAEHSHLHGHEDGAMHRHRHNHQAAHGHLHVEAEGLRLTPWVLFTLFIFGPCEPMIPLVMYPAAQGSWGDVVTVVTTFTALTIGAMIGVVLLSLKGIALLPRTKFERYSHAVAGGTVLAAGCAMQFFEL